MLLYLIKGIVLGLSAGMSPGPLQMLVISETINHGSRAGIRIAVAPLITDAPIVLLSYLVLSRLSGLDIFLGLLSLAGAVYIVVLGVENFRVKPIRSSDAAGNPRSLRKGILVNFLSPHPYLFWITVGAPIMVMAFESSVLFLVAFLAGFYLCLVGSKIIIALVVGKSRRFLEGRVYVWVNRALGALLILLALVLLWDGVGYLI